jgi:phosphoglycolate phosphatase
MPNNVVIYDFDGVIADTFEMCVDINRLSNPTLTADEYRQRFVGNINDNKAERIARSKVNFFVEYEKYILDVPLVAGITESIHHLSSHYPLVIVSSTINRPIENYLQHYQLRDAFREILGNDIATSKVEKFRMVFDRYQTTGAESVLITDTLGDIREAKQVELHTIAVTWGYHARTILEQGRPDVILDTPTTIIPTVNNLFAAAA